MKARVKPRGRLRDLMRGAFVWFLAVIALAPTPLALAHGGPLAPGDSLARATPIGLPGYAFAQAPSGTVVHYYQFESTGGNVHLRLAAPLGREPSDVAVVLVFGPEMSEDVSVPPDVERPASGGGAAFPASERATMDVPAFAARWRVLLDRELALAPGTHVIALRTQAEGPLVLVIETRGSSGLVERMVMPSLRDDVRAWEGRSSVPALLAGGVGVLAVVAYAWRTRPRAGSMPRSFLALTSLGATAMFLASGLALILDAARSGVGGSIIAVSLACALAMVFIVRRAPGRPRAWHRVAVSLVALVGFWMYAGFMWGPAIAIAGALLPEPGARPVVSE